MELRDYLRILRRNWILVLVCTLLGVLAAAGVSFLTKPTYTAKTQLFVATQTGRDLTDLQQGNSYSQARVQSYVQTVSTPIVLQPALDSLGLDISPQQLAGRVTAEAEPGTVLINVSASDESPVQAAAVAQAVARSLIQVVDDLESPNEDVDSPVKLSIITPATAPGAPSAPNTRLNLLVGLAAGLALGFGLAVLRSTLDTRVRGEADVRRITDAPILGGVAFDTDAAKKPLLTQTPSQSPRAESFRQLRTNLQFAHVSHKSHAVLVTSSLPAEGKSTTAINLAIALAQAGQRVVLVDADLRRPMVGEYLGLERNAGLTTALVGRAEVEDLLQPWGNDELYVLTSGIVPPNPSELLGSEAMKALILQLEQTFDSVVIDAPPLLPVTDAAVLAQQVGGVALVVGTQKLRSGDLEKSLNSLELVNADLLGLILNKLPNKGPDAYAYSYYTYETKESKSKGARVRTAQGGSDTLERVTGSPGKGAHFRAQRSARR